jgi:hypothetical protein
VGTYEDPVAAALAVDLAMLAEAKPHRALNFLQAPSPKGEGELVLLPRSPRELKRGLCQKVYYAPNEEAGLDPYCHECLSHWGRSAEGHVQCNREGFTRLHKWLYWKLTGESPALLLQRCGNPGCLNPAHLVASTPQEQRALALPARQGRPPVRWGNRARRKLSDVQLQEVRAALASGEAPWHIGRRLGYDSDTMHAIRRGQSYRDDCTPPPLRGEACG